MPRFDSQQRLALRDAIDAARRRASATHLTTVGFPYDAVDLALDTGNHFWRGMSADQCRIACRRIDQALAIGH